MSTADLSGKVIAIFGPTASGKTAVAEAVADAISAEIVSADSMQVYDGLPILTNQPKRPTALVAVWPLDHEGSVAEYQRLAHDAIDSALARGRTPVVVGGTGLYLRAALAELELPPAPPPGARERWERVYDRVGPEQAHAALAQRDPQAAKAVHPNDRRRVVRALELHEAGGSLAPPRDRLWSDEMRHPTLVFGLDVPKALLDQRIRERTEEMFERGVEAEVDRARRSRISKTAGQIIGLREIADLPPAEAMDAIALATRQYAAYQRKWMRRIPSIHAVSADRAPSETAAEILALARAY
ncbi:MAG TPA: tRNA (adenosine(37)-N6)-dimethylallyltransferase MiaA [Gaiellaceae bacterium]|jgi:tRNA dimethylallyltransferase|nr:tRNA (adenosine(37)-N6)-dimethylallyltransferase MiaA [Gaiellaceae bacterium]